MLERFKQSSGNTPYVVAIVVMAALGAATTLVLVWLRPTLDPLDALGKVTTLFAPTTVALLAFMKSQETHLSVNSKLDKWVATEIEAATARGYKAAQEERDKARQWPWPRD